MLFTTWDWPGIAQAATGIWLAIVATRALNTWKQQSKAERQAAFLDRLTEAAHQIVVLLDAPLQISKYVRIGFESHSDQMNADAKSVVAYIQSMGSRHTVPLREALAKCAPAITHFRSLVSKGQALGLDRYVDCINASILLTHPFDQMNSLCWLIGNTSLNWQHPEVASLVHKVVELDPEQMANSIAAQNVAILAVVQHNYGLIYG